MAISRRRFLQHGLAAASVAAAPGAVLGRGDMATMAEDVFWLPDEAEPHARTFMQWPVNPVVHPDAVFLDMLQQAIADIANTISEFEPVVMLMDERHAKSARRKLSQAIDIWNIPTDDLWCRDSGPLFVRNGSGDLAIRSVNFNGWGDKQVHDNDARIAERVAERLELAFLNNGLVGEAGGVETDGDGTLIAHESSWVNENRNDGSRDQVSALLLEALGAEKIIWAPGIKGADITDFHIDALARFAGPGKVVIQLPSTVLPEDPWSAAAFETYEILKSATDAHGRAFEMTIIPEPQDTRVISQEFVASYVNYYACNGAVIAPQFGDRKTDEEAAVKLSALYPDRKLVALNVDPIGETGGGIHCATQQQPAV